MTITLTDALVKRIKTLREQESRPGLMLRVTVEGGGCQGFEYHFDLTDSANDDDEIIEEQGISVLIDEVSLPFLIGSEIDYVDTLVESSFKIHNPNATSSCGCGTSFSV